MTSLIHHVGGPVVYPQPHDPQSTIWYVMIFDEALVDQAATITDGSWSVSPAASDPPEAGDMIIEANTIGTSATIAGVNYDQTCAIKLSGGSMGQRYTVTCTVITSAGETIQKSFILKVDHQ